jgi:Phage anti-repressor protein
MEKLKMIERRFNDIDAIENEDYEVFSKNRINLKGGRPSLEHIIKLDTAKEMAMLERNKKGKEVRQYFIKFLGICQEKSCCHMNGYTGMDKRTFSNTYKTI